MTLRQLALSCSGLADLSCAHGPHGLAACPLQELAHQQMFIPLCLKALVPHATGAPVLRGVRSTSSVAAMRSTSANASASRCRWPRSMEACLSAICGLAHAVNASVACMPAGRHGLLWTALDQTPASEASRRCVTILGLSYGSEAQPAHRQAPCLPGRWAGHAPRQRRRALQRRPGDLPARQCAPHAPRPRPSARRPAPHGRSAALRRGRSLQLPAVRGKCHGPAALSYCLELRASTSSRLVWLSIFRLAKPDKTSQTWSRKSHCAHAAEAYTTALHSMTPHLFMSPCGGCSGSCKHAREG